MSVITKEDAEPLRRAVAGDESGAAAPPSEQLRRAVAGVEAGALLSERAFSDDGHTALTGWVSKRGPKFRSAPCFGTAYKRRFLRVRGKYLLRFASETSTRCKGRAVDLSVCTVEIVDDAVDDLGEVLPFGFRLVSISKVITMAAPTAAERQQWVHAIAAAKERAIKQKLGHAPVETWERTTEAVAEGINAFKDRLNEAEREMDRAALVGY